MKFQNELGTVESTKFTGHIKPEIDVEKKKAFDAICEIFLGRLFEASHYQGAAQIVFDKLTEAGILINFPVVAQKLAELEQKQKSGIVAVHGSLPDVVKKQ